MTRAVIRRSPTTMQVSAKGGKDGQLRQVTIGFDNDQFSAIAELAKSDGTSFAEQVRTFCSWGLAEVTDE